jgi:hypothetical protein
VSPVATATLLALEGKELKMRKILPRLKDTGDRHANAALVKLGRALSGAELDQVTAAVGLAGATIGTNA